MRAVLNVFCEFRDTFFECLYTVAYQIFDARRRSEVPKLAVYIVPGLHAREDTLVHVVLCAFVAFALAAVLPINVRRVLHVRGENRVLHLSVSFCNYNQPG